MCQRKALPHDVMTQNTQAFCCPGVVVCRVTAWSCGTSGHLCDVSALTAKALCYLSWWRLRRSGHGPDARGASRPAPGMSHWWRIPNALNRGSHSTVDRTNLIPMLRQRVIVCGQCDLTFVLHWHYFQRCCWSLTVVDGRWKQSLLWGV